MREEWWARLRTCWAFNPLDRPAVRDMKHMLYFPTSVDDPRNETHGYTLGTDDDVSHESCKNDVYVHTFLLMTSSSLSLMFKLITLA